MRFHFIPAREALAVFPHGLRFYNRLWKTWRSADLLDAIGMKEWATVVTCGCGACRQATGQYGEDEAIIGIQVWRCLAAETVHSLMIYVVPGCRRYRVATEMRYATEEFTQCSCTLAKGVTKAGVAFNDFMLNCKGES